MKRLSAIALTVPSDSRTITNRPRAGKVGTASRSGLVRSKWRPVDAADAGEMGRVWRDIAIHNVSCPLLSRPLGRGRRNRGRLHAMHRDWQPRNFLLRL